MNPSELSWPERLVAAGAVQDQALEQLRTTLMAALRKTFLNRSGVDEALLEDVTQDALLKTLNNLDQFQGKSLFTTWAFAIAIRTALTELRRRHWKDVSLEQLLDDSPHGEDRAVDRAAGPQREVEQHAFVEEMYRIINTELSDKQRMALLAELKGMPLEEIGRRMGSNRNAIYKLTHDARKRLKQRLEAAGYTHADVVAN